MTELETIAHARGYLEKLANGINPLDNTPIPPEEVVNQVRLSRCFFFVADVLRRVEENGGIGEQKPAPKQEFRLTPEQLQAFPFSEDPMTITELTQRLNALADPETQKPLKTTALTDWLLSLGLLEIQEDPEGHRPRRASQRGMTMGLANREHTSINGPYTVVEYSAGAQHFILDNLEDMLHFNRQRLALQGTPWTQDQDIQLRSLLSEGKTAAQAAAVLQRQPGSVRSRMRKLGLTEPQSL